MEEEAINVRRQWPKLGRWRKRKHWRIHVQDGSARSENRLFQPQSKTLGLFWRSVRSPVSIGGLCFLSEEAAVSWVNQLYPLSIELSNKAPAIVGYWPDNDSVKASGGAGIVGFIIGASLF